MLMINLLMLHASYVLSRLLMIFTQKLICVGLKNDVLSLTRTIYQDYIPLSEIGKIIFIQIGGI